MISLEDKQQVEIFFHFTLSGVFTYVCSHKSVCVCVYICFANMWHCRQMENANNWTLNNVKFTHTEFIDIYFTFV